MIFLKFFKFNLLNFTLLSAFSISTFAAATPATPANLTTPSKDLGAQLVLKLTHGQALITQEFPAISNLNGYVVSPKNGGQSVIIYADQQGKYMFMGNLINAAGDNLSNTFTQKYVISVTAKSALNDVVGTTWFVDGKDSAPHKAYILVDPNCIYCHKLYQEVFPMIDSGNLQVRWVPVGFLKESSSGKSAALIQASLTKDAKAADLLLRQDELDFDSQNEEGGIPVLKSSDKDAQQAFDAVKSNTQFFSKYGFQGTPTLIYIDNTSHEASYFPGYLGGKDFENLVSTMSGSW